ncbi:MAG TPA: transporter substrate-binding domain-containing protein [bacterium]|nr:transporter substrate-binding domain-containing protein [bacterium]
MRWKEYRLLFVHLILCFAFALYGGGESDGRPVRVGVYENKPKIFTDEQRNASGIFISILEEIARKEGWRVTYVWCEWFDCLELLSAGQIDLLPDVALSPDRSRRFDFHKEEVVNSWSAVYAPSRREIERMADLHGHRLSVLKGSIQQTTLEEMAKGFGFAITFVEANSFEEAYRLVEEGQADAVVANHLSGDHFHRQYGLEKTPVVFQPVSLFFATTPDTNGDLLAAIDKDLRAMKSEPESTYYKALWRWMDRPPAVIVPPHLVWGIGVVGGLLVLAILFILLLRWQLRVRTRHLAEANERLRQAQKMDAVGRLAGVMAHDNNNMLTIILGCAEMGISKSRPDDPARGYFQEIANAAKRSADITRQLLAFARKQETVPRSLDLNQSVDGMLKMLRPLIRETIALDRELAADLWPVWMDPGQVEQVVANLCVNARDAIADAGRIVIETRNESFDKAHCGAHPDHIPGDFVRLTISDNGSGMTTEVLDHLFEPFFTTKGEEKGSGLGLSTVYGIVTQNGGFVTVESAPGRGTTFKVHLPRHRSG